MTTPARYSVTGRAAGQEISSTNEGRYVGIEENMMVHPTHTDGLVNKGDPVLVGDALVGVAMFDALAATDIITIDREGIWVMSVLGCVSDATADGIALAMTAGDCVFINRTTGVLSGMSGLGVPFGYVLGDVAANVATASTVAVAVHGKPLSDMGTLHFGNGFTAHADNFLLEGDTALRRSRLIEASLAPESILLAGEQIHGINLRIMDDLVSTGGEITAAELKAVRNAALTVSSATALKLDVDNKVGGVAPYARALDIMVEGAGTAPAIRSAIHFNSSGTAGTLEGIFSIEAGAFGSGDGDKTGGGGAANHYLSVIYNGVIHWIPLYN